MPGYTYKKKDMKKYRYNISLYIIIPAVFAGLAALGAMVAYRVTEYSIKNNIGISGPINLWIITITVAALIFGLVVVFILLRPVQSFIKRAKELPALSVHGIPDSLHGAEDEIQHIKKVFQNVTNVLSRVDAKQLFPEIIGESRAMRSVLSQIIKVAPTDSTVMLLGESGTGKELAAKSIYEHSLRYEKPFVTLNCVAIPGELLESELFGHEKGAFTGAGNRKIGKFEIANGGTVFLDEIGDMPLDLQAKLLRVLQEREFERVGGTKLINVDVRFIAATNKDLENLVKEGLFREDLYYRLNVFSIRIPSLNERKEDIPLLVERFLEKTPKPAKIYSTAIQMLMNYEWPGNVRELQNTMERAAVMCEKGIIEVEHLPENLRAGFPDNEIKDPETFESMSIDEKLTEFEKGLIGEALRETGGVQIRAADMLGINQRSLWHRIKKYDIDAASYKNNK